MKQVTPSLAIKEIQDAYIRENFKKLDEYFSTQNQLLNFKFLDLEFTQAANNLKVPHTLGFKPEDIIPLKVTGSGIITVNHSLCDSSNLDLSVSGACRFRFFVGTFWGVQTSRPGNKDDATEYAAEVGGGAASGVPAGTVVAFAGATVPTGWLACDGSEVNRDNYPDLFTAIGNIYGTGTNTKTFKLPDYRGRFLRGVDGTAGNDPDKTTRTAMNPGGNIGNAVGSVQDDAFQTHTHSVDSGAGNGSFSSGSLFGSTPNGGSNNLVTRDPSNAAKTTDPKAKSETRPKNAYVNYIIKT